MSKGEDQVARILREAHIPFIQEKSFTDLKHNKFRYDFYCPDVDGAKRIIEVNGEQHYHQIQHFHPTRAAYLKQQEHDRRKISYAIANNIAIYCIPYWELINIYQVDDLFNEAFRAKSRWHNDEVWTRHCSV